MNIIVDHDNDLTYETNGYLRRFFNSICIPVLNILPPKSNTLIRKSHKSVDEVVDNATTHKALELLYKKGHKKHSKSWPQKVMHKLWFGTNNSKAVRNRLQLVKRELRNTLMTLKQKDTPISILSIASGSARAVIESIVETNSMDKKISIIFLDKNPEALEYSKRLSEEHNLTSNSNCNLTWINGTAETFLRSVQDNKFDIVEMVGLLDYFIDEKAVSVFRNIKNVLNGSGIFITANISHNQEEKFLTDVIGWKMIYRSAEELGGLLLEAGFNEREIQLYYEPLEIHVVSVAKNK
ncbi:MAG: class I SAM-dependent methyltransferase family protein [Candidatus Paceibacterota bacterium]